jgi:phosphate transport system permease protein
MQLLSARTTQTLVFVLLRLCTLAIVAPVALVVYFVLLGGLPAIGWQFLTRAPQNGMLEGGIMPAIVGTIYLVAGTMLIAVPVGVLAAVYLSEYARAGPLVRLVRLAITNLAGVPSVVYGLFGLGLFVLLLSFGQSLLAGCCTLALLTLPMVITASEEALRAVPDHLRRASLALGASRWQTVRRVVLPNALPGIMTGVILSVGRCAGETAPILFTCAAFYMPELPHSISDQVMALPYHVYALATQVPHAPPQLKWGTALVLLGLVMAVNAVAIVWRARLRRGRR